MGQRTNNATWKRIRLEILSRDGWVCSYCGQDAKEVDHIIPVAHGGTDDEANLTAACVKCNRSKGTKAKPGKAQHGPKVRFFVKDSRRVEFQCVPLHNHLLILDVK